MLAVPSIALAVTALVGMLTVQPRVYVWPGVGDIGQGDPLLFRIDIAAGLLPLATEKSLTVESGEVRLFIKAPDDAMYVQMRALGSGLDDTYNGAGDYTVPPIRRVTCYAWLHRSLGKDVFRKSGDWLVKASVATRNGVVESAAARVRVRQCDLVDYVKPSVLAGQVSTLVRSHRSATRLDIQRVRILLTDRTLPHSHWLVDHFSELIDIRESIAAGRSAEANRLCRDHKRAVGPVYSDYFRHDIAVFMIHAGRMVDANNEIQLLPDGEMKTEILALYNSRRLE